MTPIPLNNYFFIQVQLKPPPYHKKAFETKIIDMSGVQQTANKDFNINEYSNQTGIITHVCQTITNDKWRIDYNQLLLNDTEIKAGDKAWFHHLTVHPHNRINIDGVTLYRQKYEQIYAIERNGEIIPTEKNVFIRPSYQSEEDIVNKYGILLKSSPGKVPNIGTVIACSTYCKDKGLKEGQTVLYDRKAEYSINYMEPLTYVSNMGRIIGVLK